MAPAPAWKSRVNAVLLMLFFWGILIGLQYRDGAFQGGSAEYGDEGPHFLNGLLIRDYATKGLPESPLRFAERFFVAYPKVAPMAWPPLFHACLATWFLLFPGSVVSALLFVSLLTAGVALLLFLTVRRTFGTMVAAVASIAFCTLPVTQHLNSVVMIDSMLALMSFGFAWQLAIYIHEPTRRNGLVLGLLGAACCLTKGNGVAALLSAPLAFLLAGRWRLTFRATTFQAAIVAVVLSAGPMLIALRLMTHNRSLHEFGLGWIGASLPAYAKALAAYCTVPLAIFVAIGILISLVPLLTRQPLSAMQAAMLAGILAIFGFHVLFPHPLDGRYMYAAVPLCLFFVPASAPDARWRGGRALALWVVVVVALYVPFGFTFRRAVPAGFREALASIRQQSDGKKIRALIASDDTGESAFIAAAAESNLQRTDVIVRSSKLLVESDWFRHRVRRLVESPEVFVERSESLGLMYLILDRTKAVRLSELQLVADAVEKFPGRIERIAAFPAGPNRLRNLEVYRFTQTAHPPRTLVKYGMPYSLGHEVSEAPAP